MFGSRARTQSVYVSLLIHLEGRQEWYMPHVSLAVFLPCCAAARATCPTWCLCSRFSRRLSSLVCTVCHLHSHSPWAPCAHTEPNHTPFVESNGIRQMCELLRHAEGDVVIGALTILRTLVRAGLRRDGARGADANGCNTLGYV